MKCALCGEQQVGPNFECGGEGEGICAARAAVDDFVVESDGDAPRTRARRARSIRASEDFPRAAIDAVRALVTPDEHSIDLALRILAALLGGGFHLDNRATEYFPELAVPWHRIVDGVVAATFTICEREGADPYARALAAMRAVGAIGDASDPDFALAAVLAQVEDLRPDDALRVLREAISTIEGRAST